MEEIGDLPLALPWANALAVGPVGGAPLSPQHGPLRHGRVADALYRSWSGIGLRDDVAAGVSAMGGLQPTVETQVAALRESQLELAAALGVGDAADVSEGLAHVEDAAQGTTGVVRENFAAMRHLVHLGHTLSAIVQRHAGLPGGDPKSDAAAARIDALLDRGAPTEESALAVTRVAVQTLRNSIQTLQRAVRKRGLSEAERQSRTVALGALCNEVAELESVLSCMAHAQDQMDLS